MGLSMRRALRRIATVALLVPGLALAASVLPLDLDGIIDRSGVAFEGRCIDTHSEIDPSSNQIVTLTTFEVKDALKGAPSNPYTIKQLGGEVGGVVNRIDGVPSFTVGEDYVVFLPGVSQLGFSSPVGLAQGSFSVKQQAEGRTVGNGRDFREMVPQAALPASAREKAAVAPGRLTRIDLNEFKQLVRQRAAR